MNFAYFITLNYCNFRQSKNCRLFKSFQNDDNSKLKEFADGNSKFDENGGKFSNRVANTVGKGEIARNEHFLLFPQCFQKTSTADT